VRVSVSILILIIVLGGMFLSVAPTQADGDEIQVLNQGAESQFPDGIRFFIQAQSPDEINDIRVFFQTIGQTSRSAYRAVEFDPDKSITGESFIHSGRAGEYIPPGTRIRYSFEIRDQAGRVLRTEEQIFVYLDIRYEWGTVSDGLITVYYQGEAMENRAGIMLKAAKETLERMRPVLGIAPKEPLHITTYSSYRDMSGALPFRSQTVRERLITQGTAFSQERVLLVLGGGNDFLGTTSHEFTHLLVADATGRASNRVPSWLNEGLAEFGNVENSGEYDEYLRRAISAGSLRPLWHLNTFSGTPGEIILFYGEGKSVVEYLVHTYGEAKMAELMRAIKKTFDIDKALEQTYGFNVYGLDSEWRLFLGVEPLPPPEEPDRQPQPRATFTPRPSPTPFAAAPTPPPTSLTTPLAIAAATPAPTAEPEPAAPAADAGGDSPTSSPGCAAPSHQGRALAELAMVALLGGPIGMLGFGVYRRRRVTAAGFEPPKQGLNGSEG